MHLKLLVICGILLLLACGNTFINEIRRWERKNKKQYLQLVRNWKKARRKRELWLRHNGYPINQYSTYYDEYEELWNTEIGAEMILQLKFPFTCCVSFNEYKIERAFHSAENN